MAGVGLRGLKLLLALERGEPGGLTVGGVALFALNGRKFFQSIQAGLLGVRGGALADLGQTAGFSLSGFLFKPQAFPLGREAGQVGLRGLASGGGCGLVGAQLSEVFFRRGGFLLRLQRGEAARLGVGGGAPLDFDSALLGGRALIGFALGGQGSLRVGLVTPVRQAGSDQGEDDDGHDDRSFLHGKIWERAGRAAS
jgi:hypothetical protein